MFDDSDIEVIHEDVIHKNHEVKNGPTAIKRQKLIKEERGEKGDVGQGNEPYFAFLLLKEDQVFKLTLPIVNLVNTVPEGRSSRDFYLRGSHGFCGWWLFVRDAIPLETDGKHYYNLLVRIDHSVLNDMSQLSICLRPSQAEMPTELKDDKLQSCVVGLKLLDKNNKKPVFTKSLPLTVNKNCGFIDHHGRLYKGKKVESDVVAITDWNFYSVDNLRKLCQTREIHSSGQVEMISIIIEAELKFSFQTKYGNRQVTIPRSMNNTPDELGKELRNDNVFYNVVFHVGPELKESVRGHISVLSRKSKTWEALFQTNLTQKIWNIDIKEIDAQGMGFILDFLYNIQTDISSLSCSSVLKILPVSHNNEIRDLTYACAARLYGLKPEEITLTTALNIFKVGCDLKIPELQQRAVAYLKLKKNEMQTKLGMKEIEKFTQETNLAAVLIVGALWG